MKGLSFYVEMKHRDEGKGKKMKAEPILRAEKITKKFGATVALNQVDMDLYRGEIRGLIGENGSGKSTLSSIISGIQRDFKGGLTFKNKPYEPISMVDSLREGIGIIVQENGTVGGVTVAENIFLGEINQFKKLGFVNKTRLYEKAQEALDKVGIDHIVPNQMMISLDMQDRKLVEIAKVMYKDPEVLIVDETTTALSYHGREILYKIMSDQKDRDKSVILISHDLDEMMEKCDALTVLRDGNFIKNVMKSEFDEDFIKKLLVGRELKGSYYREDFDCTRDDKVVLKVKGLSKSDTLKDISFDLHQGEIVGIGGLSHCGMHTLGKCLFGFERAESGTVQVNNQIEVTSERIAMRERMGYVSKDRDVEALSLNSSIRDNIAIAHLDQLKKHKLFLFNKDEKKYVQEQIDQLNIKCRSMNQAVGDLSGGNKQKVVFSKWVGRGSSILILDCPTRGVDVGVKQAMYQLIIKLKKEGKSFVLISEEMGELIGLADRILVMKDGAIKKEFYRSEELSEADIIHYMI
ncbi:sugar ABC transporter ATP-binding protein [Halalkalibacter sp. APA_J-10(15)]|uniref:sugar ABC transporter ATP-binding protein n=1 Tax=Halalkalibacter sp. APA_J-10(15) TaxID=2933805 RepID=UPI001FF4798C|nr:sugar ABC transporter ATP-binding protein [Halalkalibacter sp. APA_J-10(15)]MCK0472790.1 sugar ABC transporter ATP-binding protein [Halalkalibacter sp. APA_J-10(15)]